MSVSNADAARIKELPHRPFNDSVENKARRILKELPHLTAQDIAQVATELVAEAEAATQIAEIIKNAALQILRGVRRKGMNSRADYSKSFAKLWGAVSVSMTNPSA
jgi:hypothetical protein